MEDGFDKYPLHLACILGDEKKLAELIASGANLLEVIGDRKSTLLHIAAEYEQVPILESLLETRAVEHILTAEDHEGDTPIHIATNNIDVFWPLYNKLLSQNPQMHVDDLLNKKKRTLLHYAAGKGAIDVVKFLLAQNATKFARDIYGATPFHFAARCGSIPAMKELMGDEVDHADKMERTALHYASWNGENEAVKWLLKKGASLSKADKNGDTALHWAARSETSEVFYTLLMQPNADLFAANEAGELPLSLALHKHKGAANAEIVKRIRTALEKSNSLPRQSHLIYYARSKDGATLLHYAAAYGEKEDMDWFFKQARKVTLRKIDGKDSNFKTIVNSIDNNGNNPFHWAAMNGNSLVMEALRSYKVDPLAKNKEDRTPLLLALINNHLDFAKHLGKWFGKDLTDGMWTEDIRMWTDTFIDESLIQTFKFHMRKFIFMPGGLQEEDIKKEMPFIYKALYAKQEERTINFIQEISNVNKAGKLTGRTALHWATILNQKEIVLKLCKPYFNDMVAIFADKEGKTPLFRFVEDKNGKTAFVADKEGKTPLFRFVADKNGKTPLVAFVADKEGKTPLDYATEGEILRELMKRPDVDSYARRLYRDTERYVSSCNAILVSAALIVSVTFAGWLHPPLNDNFKYVHRLGALKIFWIFNGSSFFFAIAAVVAAASAVLPAPYHGLSGGVSSIRRSCVYAAALLAISIVFVFCAFAAASFVVLPRSSLYIKSMIWVMPCGGLLCFCFLLRSVYGLYKVHSLPLCAEAQPAKSEPHGSRPSSPQSDGRDHYELGKRHEYLAWDDGLDTNGSA